MTETPATYKTLSREDRKLIHGLFAERQKLNDAIVRLHLEIGETRDHMKSLGNSMCDRNEREQLEMDESMLLKRKEQLVLELSQLSDAAIADKFECTVDDIVDVRRGRTG